MKLKRCSPNLRLFLNKENLKGGGNTAKIIIIAALTLAIILVVTLKQTTPPNVIVQWVLIIILLRCRSLFCHHPGGNMHRARPAVYEPERKIQSHHNH
jgi:hypothetical protein